MKNLNRLLLAMIFSIISKNLYAKAAPVLPNSYNGSAPSARSMAMGSAGCALLNNAESFYYNAANLSYNKSSYVNVSFAFLGRDNSHSNERYDPSGFGLMSVSAIKDTSSFAWHTLSHNTISVINQDYSWSKVETSINSITISSSKKSANGYSSGLSLSYLYGTIGESLIDSSRNPYSNVSSGNGFACDLSFLFPLSENLSLGFNLKNLLAFMFWEKYSTDTIPWTIMSGIGYVYKGCALAFDWDKHFYRFGNLDEDTFHFGIEQRFSKIISLRVGMISDSDLNKNKMNYTYGVKANVKNYELSFACQESQVIEGEFSKFMISLKILI